VSRAESGELTWASDAGLLRFSGELDRDTLLPFWPQRDVVMQQIDTIDVSALERVDSAGLALLVHLRQIAQEQGRTLSFAGIPDKLNSLITLYNLQEIIVDNH